VPQAPQVSTSFAPEDPQFKDNTASNISDQTPNVTEVMCSPSNTSAYWTKILEVENNYLDTLQSDLYLSTSDSSMEEEEYIDPLNLDWDKLIVIDEWPTPEK